MSYFAWKPYVPVAKRREQAAKKLATMQKKGANVSPVVLQSRTIAASFWGKSWCDNLERYSDYESRMPRGRSYVRNGSVLDLQIAKGEIKAKVSGSELYTIEITVAPVASTQWKSICSDSVGSIDSVVELLQGRLAKGVMDRVCRQGDGLFPGPKEIKLSCSCPDWADMCKHVAAALYGVGARLDRQPDLLFVLRGVDAKDMIAGASERLAVPKRSAAKEKVLADDDMAALFGLDMAAEGEAGTVAGQAAAVASGAVGIEPRGKAKAKATAKTKSNSKTMPPERQAKPNRKPTATTPRVAKSSRTAIAPKSKGRAPTTRQGSASRKKTTHARPVMA